MNLTNINVKLSDKKIGLLLLKVTFFLGWLLLFTISFSMAHADINETRINPKIIEFKVSVVEKDGRFWQQLSWQTEGANGVRLFKNGKEIPGRVELNDGKIGWPSTMPKMKLRLKRDSVFKLVAENDAGLIASETVNFKMKRKNKKERAGDSKKKVKLYPRIKSFYVTPQTVKAGEWIKFHWDVKDADKIKLYDELGEIDLRTDHKRNGGLRSFFSSPIDKTTQFKLVAFDGKKKPAVKTYTVNVEEPTNRGRCEVTGRLTGKWKQQVKDKPNGPASTWVVSVYVTEKGASRPLTKATVNNKGRYRIKDLENGKNYTIKPSWSSNPTQVKFSCDGVQLKSVFDFNITGSPRLD